MSLSPREMVSFTSYQWTKGLAAQDSSRPLLVPSFGGVSERRSVTQFAQPTFLQEALLSLTWK